MRPIIGQWVLLRGHIWIPPGTQPGYGVLWVDAVEGTWSGDLATRADRFAKRVAS
ncbi:MAG: hypothetical protein ACRDYC_01665 [Acidimicrobiales bacterium]